MRAGSRPVFGQLARSRGSVPGRTDPATSAPGVVRMGGLTRSLVRSIFGSGSCSPPSRSADARPVSAHRASRWIVRGATA